MANIRGTLIIAMAVTTSSMVSAQKLPQIQANGVWAPQNIKTDGLPDEWTSFQAYNKATNIFYTLCNDDSRLYLAVQATDPVIINKITTCGITLTIRLPDNTTAVTFPAYDKENKAISDIMINAPKVKGGTDQTQTDTFIAARNQMRNTRQKIIRVARNATENDISVYNDEGIKVAGRISADLTYTQELAIPLIYLGVKAGDSFNYVLQVNGQIPKGAIIPNTGRPDIIAFTGADGVTYMVGRATPDNMVMAYSTTFKGIYTMARK